MSEELEALTEIAAALEGVDPKVLERLVGAESGGRQQAVSPKGAKGLTQLMPDTARDMGVNPDDPVENVMGGAKYLARQKAKFGRYDLALAAYNAGPGRVEKAGDIPKIKETQDYVKKFADLVPVGEEANALHDIEAAMAMSEIETATKKPQAAGPPFDATSETLAQFAGPAGEMVGQALDLPMKPIRAALAKFHEKVIEPQRARTEKEWAETPEEVKRATPEAFAPLPNKDVFVETMSQALVPFVYGAVGKGMAGLGKLAETGMYRYGPDFLFRGTAQGGLPAIAKELTEAEMARSNPYTRARLMAERIMPEGEAAAGETPSPLPTPARGEGEVRTAGAEARPTGTPMVPGEEVEGAQGEVRTTGETPVLPPEWQARVKASGEPVIYKSRESAEAAAGYINRPRRAQAKPGEGPTGLQEARAVETEDGWILETRAKGEERTQVGKPVPPVRPPEPRFEGEPPEWQGKVPAYDPRQEAIDQQQRIIERLDEKIAGLKNDKAKEKWSLKKQAAVEEIKRLEAEQEPESRGQGPGARGQGKKAGPISRAEDRGDMASLIRLYGGFRSDAGLIQNYEPEERKSIYLFSRKGEPGARPQGPDELAQELRNNHPEMFGHIENGEQLLSAIARGDIYKKANLDKMIKDAEDSYADLEKVAAAEGHSPEDVARAQAEDQELYRAERDAIQSEGSTGEGATAWDFEPAPQQEGPALAQASPEAGTQVGKPVLPEETPDPIISPDGEITRMHSGGPDTAEVARNLEERVWETLAHHKIFPWGKTLRGRMAKAVPATFMRQGFKNWLNLMYFPRTIAQKWGAFRPFYETDLTADDVMADHRYEIWGGLTPYMKELGGAERKRVHAVALKLDRVKEAGKRRGIEDKIIQRGPEYFSKEHNLSAREAEAAHGLWGAYRYVRQETLKAMMQDVVDLGKKYGLNESRAREFAADILQKDLGGDYFPLHYSIMKFLPGKEGLLFDVLTRQRENYDFWSRERALYMYPHTRWGPYWLHIYDQEGQLRWAGAAESIGEYKKMAAKLKKEFAGQEVEFKESRREKIPMELYNNVDMPGLAAIMELARDQFEGEAWAKFLEAKQAFFAAKGWGAHKIHRSDIPGFETENDKRVISDYFEGWIGMQGKTARVRGFSDAWQGFRQRNGGDDEGLMKYTQGYVNYLLEHPREASRVRRILYHLYLGGSMGFRVLHGLHAVQTAWPEMSLITKQPGRVLSRAMKDRFQLTAFEQGWSKQPGLSGEELEALGRGRRKAALSTDYTAEMAARSASPMYRWLQEEPQGTAAKLKNAFDLIYYPTGMDRFTREAIFLGAVRELRGKGPITQAVVDRAAEVVGNSMYRYARGERPRFMRREGALLSTFQTWSAKYFQQIFGYMRDSRYGALGRLVAAAGLVGGLNALGMKDVIEKAYRKAYGRNAEADAKHYLQTILGERGGEALNRIMFRGLPAGVAGFDLSPRMVHHLPWNFLAEAWTHPTKLLGAPFGPFEALPRAGKALAEQHPGRALEAVAPTWLRNPMAAYRLYERGPETVSGRPIMGRDLKRQTATAGEAGRKALGLQPTRLSEEQSQQETTKAVTAERQGKLRDWAARYVQAREQKDGEEQRRIVKEWHAYNQEMRRAGRRADLITPLQFWGSVKIRIRPKYPEGSAKRTRLRQGQ